MNNNYERPNWWFEPDAEDELTEQELENYYEQYLRTAEEA